LSPEQARRISVLRAVKQGKKSGEIAILALDFVAATKQHGRVQKGEP
jgi:hypothetical protein